MPPNRRGSLDLVRGENTNGDCVTKAAGIIYASDIGSNRKESRGEWKAKG
jgi:hypothetical protein